MGLEKLCFYVDVDMAVVNYIQLHHLWVELQLKKLLNY